MIANSAETKMIAGRIWKANTTPMLECCLPDLAEDELGAG